MRLWCNAVTAYTVRALLFSNLSTLFFSSLLFSTYFYFVFSSFLCFPSLSFSSLHSSPLLSSPILNSISLPSSSHLSLHCPCFEQSIASCQGDFTHSGLNTPNLNEEESIGENNRYEIDSQKQPVKITSDNLLRWQHRRMCLCCAMLVLSVGIRLTI